jgi:DNA (cytosine-5)-methyltransferase 1
MNHIELFAGCGGLSLGLETAGFDLLLANEISPMASETFAYNILNADLNELKNHQKVLWISSSYERKEIALRLRENPEIASGLKSHQFSDIKKNALTNEDLKRSLLVGSISDLNILLDDKDLPLLKNLQNGLGNGHVDLVSGGPPCQSFSLAGLRDHSNKRNQLPWEFAKFVNMVKPKVAMLENVSGILRAFKIGDESYHAWFEVSKAFATIGYIPLCLHVNAKYVGAAQNRPRFIMIGLREDIFIKIIKNSKDDKFAKLSSPVKAFFDRVRQGEDPEYGCLPCFDVDKNPEFFSLEIFESLVTNKNNDLVTVKDAIDDLRSSKIKKSTYVESLNNTFSNPNQNACDKSFNHEKRLNNPKVRARFRIYQIMTKLNKKEFYEVSKYLKTGGESGISITTLKLMQAHWILDLDGNVNPRPEKHQLIQLLKNLNTKKQTQRALLANLPAPAALSIPDDACHYHESIDCQRTLTVREMARIQSFPDWYKIRSKVTTGGKMRKFEVPQYTQIGNAVPPLLGLALGKVCEKLINLSECRL